jgi:hypothetical protein
MSTDNKGSERSVFASAAKDASNAGDESVVYPPQLRTGLRAAVDKHLEG